MAIGCNHVYKEMDAEVVRTNVDDETINTKVDAIFYCEKCLDVKQIVKWIEGEYSL